MPEQQLSNLTTATSSTDLNTGTPTPPSWRPPANAPAWAQGKSPEEILGIAQQLYSHVETMQASTPQAAPNAAAPAAGNNDDYLTVGQLNQQLAFAQQNLVNPLLEQNAQVAWQLAKQESPDIVNRYGPEALQYWQRLPANQRTLDGARMVLKLVRGNHFDELTAEAVRQATVGEPGFRSGTSGQGAPAALLQPLESETIPEEWRKKAAALDLKVEDLRDFCKANGMTMDQYFAKFVTKTITGGAK